MAKGCRLATGTLNDRRGFMVYAAAAEPYLQKCGAKMFIRDAHTDIREGNPGHFTVPIECPSVEAAKAAYEAPEYQDMFRLRTNNAKPVSAFLRKETSSPTEFDEESAP